METFCVRETRVCFSLIFLIARLGLIFFVESIGEAKSPHRGNKHAVGLVGETSEACDICSFQNSEPCSTCVWDYSTGLPCVHSKKLCCRRNSA